MTDRTLPVTEDELHAYLDGELPGDRIAGVEAWLAAHPDDMAKVAAWRAQSDAIRARYGSVADETVPTRFDLDQMMKADRSWRKPAAAAAVIAFVLGGALGWFAHTPVMSAVNQNTKGFETFDFSLGAKVSGFDVSAFIENAFDKRGILSINTVCTPSICGAGRRFYPIKPQVFGIKLGHDL